MGSIRWGNDRILVVIGIGPERPVRIDSLDVTGHERGRAARQPMVELLLLGDGRALNNTRFTDTGVGERLRYVAHRITGDEQTTSLTVDQRDAATGLETSTTLTAHAGVAAIQARTAIRNCADTDRLVQMVGTLALGCVLGDGERLDDLVLLSARSSWCAESRWSTTELRADSGLSRIATPPDVSLESRSHLAAISTSTWSTGRFLPTAVIDNRATGRALAWQIEHNGAWRWELAARWAGPDEVAVILSGPNDLDHQWTLRLAPGEVFETVPVSVAVSAGGWQGAIGALTAHRRAIRRPLVRPDLPVIFNDYMNTLMGDPTTERLLPLIDAAAQAGAEYFCVDAGWYDDGGDWWPSVGDWQPSATRFPDGGLARVLDHIRGRGMVPGLWLEPEVIGVRSPAAERLPDAAFLQRYGHRVVEQERYFLDLRHAAARAHLDEVVDRLVWSGVGYLKLDYNVTPGAGTDRDAVSAGDGLLRQNRAHLDWLRGVRERHPEVLIENCASGAMRMDYALMSLLELQSTSDQTDPLRYAPIAAAAPMSLTPEQAGNWAYPQPGMTAEEIAFCLVNGLAGRLYLSGHLDRMSAGELDLVRQGVAAYRAIRSETAQAVPCWPLGLPSSLDPVVALGLRSPVATYLCLWFTRPGGHDRLTVSLPGAGGGLTTVYPAGLRPWDIAWDQGTGTLTIDPRVSGPTARMLRIG